jgi:hypothetical protein
MSLQRGINLRALAEKMGQCSGAEVRGICTEAGMSSDLNYLVVVSNKVFQVCTLFERDDNMLRRRISNSLLPRFVGRLMSLFSYPMLISRSVGAEKEPRRKYFRQQALLVDHLYLVFYRFFSFSFPNVTACVVSISISQFVENIARMRRNMCLQLSPLHASTHLKFYNQVGGKDKAKSNQYVNDITSA